MERFRWLEYGASPTSRVEEEAAARPADPLEEGERLYLEGEYEPALRRYAMAMERDATLPEAWAGKVRCLLGMQRLREAVVWSEKAVRLLPEEPAVLSAHSLVLARAGRAGEGLESSDRALRILGRAADRHPAVWLERGCCFLCSGRRSAAESCFERVRAAVSGREGSANWWQRLGLAYLEAGEAARALREFNQALEAVPERPYLWLLTAQAAGRLRLWEKADFALERALALRPGYERALRERERLRRTRKSLWLRNLLRFFGVED